MPTVEYLEDLQTHSKGDRAWLDQNSADEQTELGVLKIVSDDVPSDELDEDEVKANTLRGVREAAEEKASKGKSKK